MSNFPFRGLLCTYFIFLKWQEACEGRDPPESTLHQIEGKKSGGSCPWTSKTKQPATSLPAQDTSAPFEPPCAAWTWGLSHSADLELCSHRYQHAVRVCALQEDLSSLPYGDLTEVSRAQSSNPQQCTAARMQVHCTEALQALAPSHPGAPDDRRVPGDVGKVRLSHPVFSTWVLSWEIARWM